jgi:hypothetical protein
MLLQDNIVTDARQRRNLQPTITLLAQIEKYYLKGRWECKDRCCNSAPHAFAALCMVAINPHNS